jgi:hypothetical protein
MIMLHENSLSHGNPLSRKTTAFSMNDADRDFGLCPQWFHMMCTGRKAGTIHRWNGWDSWTMLEKSAAAFLAACRYMSCWSRIFDSKTSTGPTFLTLLWKQRRVPLHSHKKEFLNVFHGPILQELDEENATDPSILWNFMDFPLKEVAVWMGR